jgi:AraC-like DNA-binding protein
MLLQLKCILPVMMILIRQRGTVFFLTAHPAGAVALSRTALYEKFQRFLGYSAHQYIKRTRTEEIARLLAESEMSIHEIAFAMGFSSEAHIAMYFYKYKGMNPSQYRRQFTD